MKGRPKINRTWKSCSRVCYETIEIGNRKKADVEAAIARAKENA